MDIQHGDVDVNFNVSPGPGPDPKNWNQNDLKYYEHLYQTTEKYEYFRKARTHFIHNLVNSHRNWNVNFKHQHDLESFIFKPSINSPIQHEILTLKLNSAGDPKYNSKPASNHANACLPKNAYIALGIGGKAILSPKVEDCEPIHYTNPDKIKKLEDDYEVMVLPPRHLFNKMSQNGNKKYIGANEKCSFSHTYLGISFDGYDIVYDPEQPDKIDRCNGGYGQDGIYRYYIKNSYPFFLSCFKDQLMTVPKNWSCGRKCEEFYAEKRLKMMEQAKVQSQSETLTRSSSTSYAESISPAIISYAKNLAEIFLPGLGKLAKLESGDLDFSNQTDKNAKTRSTTDRTSNNKPKICSGGLSGEYDSFVSNTKPFNCNDHKKTKQDTTKRSKRSVLSSLDELMIEISNAKEELRSYGLFPTKLEDLEENLQSDNPIFARSLAMATSQLTTVSPRESQEAKIPKYSSLRAALRSGDNSATCGQESSHSQSQDSTAMPNEGGGTGQSAPQTTQCPEEKIWFDCHKTCPDQTCADYALKYSPPCYNTLEGNEDCVSGCFCPENYVFSVKLEKCLPKGSDCPLEELCLPYECGLNNKYSKYNLRETFNWNRHLKIFEDSKNSMPEVAYETCEESYADLENIPTIFRDEEKDRLDELLLEKDNKAVDVCDKTKSKFCLEEDDDNDNAEERKRKNNKQTNDESTKQECRYSCLCHHKTYGTISTSKHDRYKNSDQNIDFCMKYEEIRWTPWINKNRPYEGKQSDSEYFYDIKVWTACTEVLVSQGRDAVTKEPIDTADYFGVIKNVEDFIVYLTALNNTGFRGVRSFVFEYSYTYIQFVKFLKILLHLIQQSFPFRSRPLHVVYRWH